MAGADTVLHIPGVVVRSFQQERAETIITDRLVSQMSQADGASMFISIFIPPVQLRRFRMLHTQRRHHPESVLTLC